MRTLNALIEEELQRRGYEKIRPAHGALLANLDLDGNTVTVLAERAEMTKQAMGVLADELVELGYLTRRVDPSDARARILEVTATGHALMLDQFAIIEQIEEQYENVLGERTMDGLRTGLAAFMGVRQMT